LSTYLHLGLPYDLFPSGFPTHILYTFLCNPILNKQSQKADKGWDSSLGFREWGSQLLTVKNKPVTKIHKKPVIYIVSCKWNLSYFIRQTFSETHYNLMTTHSKRYFRYSIAMRCDKSYSWIKHHAMKNFQRGGSIVPRIIKKELHIGEQSGSRPRGKKIPLYPLNYSFVFGPCSLMFWQVQHIRRYGPICQKNSRHTITYGYVRIQRGRFWNSEKHGILSSTHTYHTTMPRKQRREYKKKKNSLTRGISG
jgi:hypothetical protein